MIRTRQDCFDRCAQHRRLLDPLMQQDRAERAFEHCRDVCWHHFPPSLWERFINWVLVGR